MKLTAPNPGLNEGSNLVFQGRLLPHKLHEYFGNAGQAAVLSPDYAPVPLDGQAHYAQHAQAVLRRVFGQRVP